METLQIRRVALRCRIASSLDQDRARARRLFRDEIALALENAIARAAVAPDEQVCIRKLRTSARLWMGLTDDALRNGWADTVATEIRRAIDHGESNTVVRYSSFAAGVFDAVLSLARGESKRHWAWQQLGLAAGVQPSTSPAQARETICELLVQHAELIVPALKALITDRPFQRVLLEFHEDQLVRLADAALARFGCSFIIDDRIDAPVEQRAGGSPRAVSIARCSWIAHRLIVAGSSYRHAVAAAILAILEAESALVRNEASAHAAVDAVLHARGWRLVCADDHRTGDASVFETPAAIESKTVAITPDAHSRAESATSEMTGHRYDARTTRDSSSSSHRPPRKSRFADVRGGRTNEYSGDPEYDAGTDTAEIQATRSLDSTASQDVEGNSSEASTRQSTGEPGEAEFEVVDYRERACSDWGGVLFLINMLRDVGLADQLVDDPELERRPLAWVLHQLALMLVPAEPRDPAALAFAGLPPDAEPPDRDQPPADETEQPALLRYVRMCIDHTCQRLEREAGQELFYMLCGRRAEIVADPGWVEVRFPLSSVSVDIRRSALDVDPGYVPWLGIVVKFTYV